jgi:hypothetical protein
MNHYVTIGANDSQVLQSNRPPFLRRSAQGQQVVDLRIAHSQCAVLFDELEPAIRHFTNQPSAICAQHLSYLFAPGFAFSLAVVDKSQLPFTLEPGQLQIR